MLPGLALTPTAFPIPQFEMLNAELEENQELANSRMAELEKLQAELQGAVRTNERLKVGCLGLGGPKTARWGLSPSADHFRASLPSGGLM